MPRADDPESLPPASRARDRSSMRGKDHHDRRTRWGAAYLERPADCLHPVRDTPKSSSRRHGCPAPAVVDHAEPHGVLPDIELDHGGIRFGVPGDVGEALGDDEVDRRSHDRTIASSDRVPRTRTRVGSGLRSASSSSTSATSPSPVPGAIPLASARSSPIAVDSCRDAPASTSTSAGSCSDSRPSAREAQADGGRHQ